MPGPLERPKPNPMDRFTPEHQQEISTWLKNPVRHFPKLLATEAATGFAGARANGEKALRGIRSLVSMGTRALSSLDPKQEAARAAHDVEHAADAADAADAAMPPTEKQIRARVMLETEYQRALDELDAMEKVGVTKKTQGDYAALMRLVEEYSDQIASYGGQL